MNIEGSPRRGANGTDFRYTVIEQHLPRGYKLSMPAEAIEETRFIFAEIVLARQYSPILEHVKTSGPIAVIDVGAHIGIFSCWLSRERTIGSAFCVEPSPSLVPILDKNLRSSRVPNVMIIPMAAGRASGRSLLSFDPALPANAQVGQEPNGAHVARVRHSLGVTSSREAMKELQVEVFPLDQIVDDIDADEVDLLKVDVEGSELDVLDGISGANMKRIRAITVEIQAPTETSSQLVIRRLQSFGYNVDLKTARLIPASFNNHMVFAWKG